MGCGPKYLWKAITIFSHVKTKEKLISLAKKLKHCFPIYTLSEFKCSSIPLYLLLKSISSYVKARQCVHFKKATNQYFGLVSISHKRNY